MEPEAEKTPDELKKSEEKFLKIKGKMDAFMVEIGEDVLDEEILNKTKDHTLKLFQRNGIRFSRETLGAFIEGATLVLGSQSDHQTMIQVIMAQKVILKKMQDQIKEQVDKAMQTNGASI